MCYFELYIFTYTNLAFWMKENQNRNQNCNTSEGGYSSIQHTVMTGICPSPVQYSYFNTRSVVFSPECSTQETWPWTSMVLWAEGGRSWSWRSHLDNGGGNQRVRGKLEKEREERRQSGRMDDKQKVRKKAVYLLTSWYMKSDGTGRVHQLKIISQSYRDQRQLDFFHEEEEIQLLDIWVLLSVLDLKYWLIYPFSIQQKTIWRHPHLENESCDRRRNTHKQQRQPWNP